MVSIGRRIGALFGVSVLTALSDFELAFRRALEFGDPCGLARPDIFCVAAAEPALRLGCGRGQGAPGSASHPPSQEVTRALRRTGALHQ
jgi:hypothetical protein